MSKKKEPKTYDEHLGRVIGALAEEQGKTQAQVAEAAGMTLTTYGRRERGEIPFLVSEVELIAHYLNESPGYILQRALKNFGGIHKMLSGATGKTEHHAGEDDLGAVPILSRRQSEAVTPEKKAARRGSKEDQE